MRRDGVQQRRESRNVGGQLHPSMPLINVPLPPWSMEIFTFSTFSPGRADLLR